MDSLITTFHIDWKIIIAQAFNFGIVFVVLYLFAIKPLQKLMAERTGKIKRGLTDSEEAKKFLEQAKEEHKKNLINLQKISTESKKELNKELEEIRDQNLEKMRIDTEEWVKKGKVQLEIDKKILVDGAMKEIFVLAAAIAQKVVGKDAHYEEKILKELSNLEK